MEFNYFDLIVSIIILMLGLKGIINGFFKEVFGLIGIIGGIFVASRLGDDVGNFLNDLIFKFDNNSAISFTGFLATLAVFWLLMILIGFIFKKLSSLSGLGVVDRIFGFIIGASKFFFIAAVIAHAVYNIKAAKAFIDDSSLSTSVVFPILVETGSVIMKLDPIEISEDINSTAKAIEESVSQGIENSAQEIIDTTKKQITDAMPEIAKETDMNKGSN